MYIQVLFPTQLPGRLGLLEFPCLTSLQVSFDVQQSKRATVTGQKPLWVW